LKIWNHKILL